MLALILPALSAAFPRGITDTNDSIGDISGGVTNIFNAVADTSHIFRGVTNMTGEFAYTFKRVGETSEMSPKVLGCITLPMCPEVSLTVGANN